MGLPLHLMLRALEGLRFDVYVDSVNGNDANSGVLANVAKQTIAGIGTITAGLRIGLARGSYWREQLGTTAGYVGDVTVGCYGSGTIPVLDGADIVPSGDWAVTAGRTGVYEATVAAPADSTGEYLSLWEDGERLVWVSSVANCEATVGSYYVADTTGASTAVYYVHPTGSSDPRSDGKVYEASVRRCGIKLGDNANVRLVHTRRSVSRDGSLVVGDNSTVSRCVAEDGTKHNIFVGAGSTVTKAVAWGCDIPSRSNSTLFVCYSHDATGKSSLFDECVAVCDISLGEAARVAGQGINGFFAHASSASYPHLAVTYRNCSVRGAVTAFGGADIVVWRDERCYAEGVDGGILASFVAGSSEDLCVIEVAPMVNRQAIQPYGGSMHINGLRSYGFSAVPKGVVYTETPGLVEMQNSAVYRKGQAGYMFIICANHADADIRASNNIVDAEGGWTCVLQRPVSYGDSQGNVYSPENLLFRVSGGADYASLTAWKAAFPALDTNSVSGNPLLVDPANGDFSVSPGSPALAIGAGLLRPSVAYTPIPATLADALAWVQT